MVSQGEVIKDTEVNVLKLEIGKLNIRQDEVLVVSVPDDTLPSRVERLMQVLTNVLPPKTKCFVYRGEIEMSVIHDERTG